MKNIVTIFVLAAITAWCITSWADSNHYPRLQIIDLPDDPGRYGRLTLEGVDNDGDGLRDDIQIYIAETYAHSEKLRRVIADMAIAQQDFILSAGDLEKTLDARERRSRAIACLWYIDPDNAYKIHKQFKPRLLNTEARTRAYIQADGQLSGMVFGLPGDGKSQCSFDPDHLSN